MRKQCFLTAAVQNVKRLMNVFALRFSLFFMKGRDFPCEIMAFVDHLGAAYVKQATLFLFMEVFR